MKCLAGAAFINECSCKRDSWYTAVVKPNQVGQAINGLCHSLSLFQRHGQRFLAKHDFSCLGRSQCYRSVQHVRSCYVHNLDVRSADHSPPISFRSFPTPLRRHRVSLGAISAADYLPMEFVRNIEEVADLMKGGGM